MKIKSVSIENFRSIRKQSFNSKELSIFIGNNGTGKTSILEAVNFCLSPQFLSSRIKHTDFYKGTEEPIIIQLEFDEPFIAKLPDGFTTQSIECDKIFLEIKKRQKATAGKAFSDIVTITHHVVPNTPKTNESGWVKQRKSGNPFKFDERLLSFSQVELENMPRSFYFGKNRERQLQKGYNSSISSVFDDFNWRFLKAIKDEEMQPEEEKFSYKKDTLEKEIITKVNDAAKKSIEALNKKLKNFEVDGVDVSFIDGGAPFDSAFLSQKLEKLDLPISNLGSGVEMIISLLFLETLASLSKTQIIVLIDEPELHLHPHLQGKFVQYLIDFSKTNQVFLSTHSPYFFKNCLNNNQIELLIAKKENELVAIENTSNKFGLFPWSPSWGEINYSAYDLPTIEFHNELYGYIQEKEKKYRIEDIESFFVQRGIQKTRKWIKSNAGVAMPPYDITLISYIRNSIHHPENANNDTFSEQELREAIDTLINLL